ncbi:PqiC family protein [Pseudaestuariivita sp.]|uniref:PqiC family protein n=1 Tax=Pseudaestuariivita sp. TaxID=2211669 RepID=UPI004059AACF
MMLRTFLTALSLPLIAACGGQDVLATAPKVAVTERVPSHFRSIEVVEVSLPNYASGEQVAVSEDGALVLSDVLWADDPVRAVTLSLARNLTELTGARVAPEPWPFDGFAAARVDVRVEELLVVDGALRMSGQYFVADLDGLGRDHAHLFDVAAPLTDLTAGTTAAGRAVLIATLAREIAKTAL